MMWKITLKRFFKPWTLESRRDQVLGVSTLVLLAVCALYIFDQALFCWPLMATLLLHSLLLVCSFWLSLRTTGFRKSYMDPRKALPHLEKYARGELRFDQLPPGLQDDMKVNHARVMLNKDNNR
jgi:hypothetical protein